MSLILEALKKSETRRRLGEAPDLGTPFTVKRRRRNPLPLVVILIAVAAGLGWWYVRTMPPPMAGNTIVSLPAPPAAGRNPAAAQQQARPSAAKTPLSAPLPARDSVQGQAKPDAPIQAMTATPPARADGSAVNPTVSARTADLQAARAAMNRRQPPAPAAPGPATANTPAIPAPTMPMPGARPTPPSSVAAATAPVKPSTDTSVAAPAPANDATASSDAAAPGRADTAERFPQYYELVYAVRKDIPPFALSMHVYAANAAGRFVVVDGERKVEGDAVKEGLTLREIRPDGMVLEFRGQRFFYPRPGH